jgi:enamine deaminase RidA (YjgF/YER057c/UK114 family)
MNIVLQERIKALGLILPPAPKPMGIYRPLLVVGEYLYISGQGPILKNGDLITGKVGKTMDRDQGKNAARQVGLTMLSTLVTHMESKK